MISRNQENFCEDDSQSNRKQPVKLHSYPISKSPDISQIKQINPSDVSLIYNIPGKSFSENEVYYEASPLFDYEYLHFSALLPPASLSKLKISEKNSLLTADNASSTSRFQNSSIIADSSNSICEMEKPLVNNNTPFNLNGAQISKSYKVAPFCYQELGEDEIKFLNILRDELFPLDQIKQERLIDEKLKDLGYDQPSFWQWSNPRKYFSERPWAKHLLKIDRETHSEDSDYEFDLDDVYFGAYSF